MTQPQVDFNNLQSITKPRDKAWENWSKFTNVGDSYQGFIRDVFFKKGSGDFPDQRVLTLEQPDGEFVNVGIKYVDFVLEKTNDLRLNDPVKIVFAKELQPQVKGHNPTKQFEFYGQNLPENEAQKTVLELETIDKKAVEQTSSVPTNNDQTASSGSASGVAQPQATPAQPAANDLPFESNPSPAQPTGAVQNAPTQPAANAAPTQAAPAPEAPQAAAPQPQAAEQAQPAAPTTPQQ